MDHKKVFTWEELCAIIKVCGDARVTELKLGDLSLRFDRPVEAETSVVVHPAPAPKVLNRLSKKAAAEIAELQKQDAEKSLLLDEIAAKEDQLAQMWIENPARAEELLLKGDLEEPSDNDANDE